MTDLEKLLNAAKALDEDRHKPPFAGYPVVYVKEELVALRVGEIVIGSLIPLLFMANETADAEFGATHMVVAGFIDGVWEKMVIPRNNLEAR